LMMHSAKQLPRFTHGGLGLGLFTWGFGIQPAEKRFPLIPAFSPSAHYAPKMTSRGEKEPSRAV
jgi:hypothetical protein